MIGYAFCGSFCTASRSIEALEKLTRSHSVLPIFSEAFASTDTRFGNARELTKQIEDICSQKGIYTIAEAEKLGPSMPLEALIISPCTGNTLAKMACAITDSTVTMAAKAHLRNCKALIIALASNDALSANLKNIGLLLSRKNVYFVPLGQDDPVSKSASLVCDFSKIESTLNYALLGVQIQPLLL